MFWDKPTEIELKACAAEYEKRVAYFYECKNGFGYKLHHKKNLNSDKYKFIKKVTA